jgi:hypothetical protein
MLSIRRADGDAASRRVVEEGAAEEGAAEEGAAEEGAVEEGAVEEEDSVEAGIAVAAPGLAAACPLCSLSRSETMLDMVRPNLQMDAVHASDAGRT